MYFRRRGGKLWKLGDGTFGVVYVVHSELRDNDFAAKLLYDNESTTPRALSRLPAEAVTAIADRVLEEEKWPAERAATLRSILLSTYRTPDASGLALAQAGLSDWEPVLARIRKRANSTAVERFNRESRVSGIIRADQLSRSSQAQVSGTVDIIGSTRRFQSYPAYQHLKAEFAEAGVTISDYALVMDKYEFSLKDLLERGPGDAYWIAPAVREDLALTERVSASLTGIFQTREVLERRIDQQPALDDEQRQRLRTGIDAPDVGYELLKRMTFDDRIRTALPFLRDIVVGLSRLHRVSYDNGGPLFHLDIKPANIYVTRDDTKGIVCALGDLGFLPPEPQLDRTIDTSVDDLPLGTLHYRSPEQKEHFDVANVEVRIEGDTVCLDVGDPKFRGSFIEKGDSVLFSRDKSRVRHIIQDIIPTAPTRVLIPGGLAPVKDGEQTQVIFLKRQEYRTDLFGVGAIAFDLVSCGKSSERFYESIRRFEFDGAGRGSVDSTVAKYRRVKDGLADEPELIHIFEPLRQGSDYAPEGFVELILRCMLYKADKTFYAPYEEQRPTPQQINSTPHFEDARSKAITDVLAYIDTELDYKNNSFALVNPLVTLKPPKPPTTRVDRLGTIINRLQQPDSDWRLRLARSAYYYEKLATLVQDRTKGPEHPFLYQMLPAAIRWLPKNEQSPFQFAYSAYISARDYESDLVVGDMDKMLKTVTHPFVPQDVAYARREVMLSPDASDSTADGRHFALRFLDAAPVARGVRVGDWIVSRSPDDERRLWRIVEATGTDERPHVVVAPASESTQPLAVDDKQGEVEALYYSRLVPAKYYLDVLGLYLLNLAVANSPVTCNGREKINVHDLLSRADGASTMVSPGLHDRAPRPGIIDGIRELFQGERNQLRDILAFTAYIYLRLTWHDSVGSYYGKAAQRGTDDVDPSEFLLDVVNDAKTLRNEVEDFLGVPRNTFENEWPTERRLGHVSEGAQRDFAALVAAPVDIKQLMVDLLR